MTAKKCITIFANPDSGSATPEGLKEIRVYLKKHSPNSKVIIIKSPRELKQKIAQIRPDSCDAVGVYAGDGTVLLVVKAASAMDLPVLILPGGTANALATDFHLPTTIVECLDLFFRQTFVLARADIASANGQDFILDLHYGIWAQAIGTASTEDKQRLGQLAYVKEVIAAMGASQEFQYDIELDGRRRTIPGYALMVANGGFQNVFGLPLFPQRHRPGHLQVALIRTVSPGDLLRWYWLRRLGRRKVSAVIAIYQAREIVVHAAPPHLIFDDNESRTKLPMKIYNTGRTANIIAPLPVPQPSLWQQLFSRPAKKA